MAFRPGSRKTRNALRCFCSRSPILAVYGLDDDGELYVHQKTFKGNRIYNEIFVKPKPGTTMKLHCRECLRWQEIRITLPSSDVALVTVDQPKAIGEQ